MNQLKHQILQHPLQPTNFRIILYIHQQLLASTDNTETIKSFALIYKHSVDSIIRA